MNELSSASNEPSDTSSPEPSETAAARWSRLIDSGMQKLHPEEKYVIVLALAGILISHFFGKGFTFSVSMEYLMIFARHIGLYFMGTRVLLFLGTVWQPTGARSLAFKRYVFGDTDPSKGCFQADVAFLRGLFLMFFALGAYTNVKIRIPYINSYTGDEFFQRLDHWIFGESVWPWLTQFVRSHPDWLTFLQDTYSHDYVYMVFLVFLLHLRRDVLAMRWCFASVGVLYLSAIFITLLYPTLGPCFYYWDQWQWLVEIDPPRIYQTQWSLVQTMISLVGLAEMQERIQAHAFYGIAAFPSLHCGHMVLLMVVAWYRHRLYILLAGAMAFLTFIATMVFGWHYAIDGVAGAVMAVIVPVALWRLMLRDEADKAVRDEADKADRVDRADSSSPAPASDGGS